MIKQQLSVQQWLTIPLKFRIDLAVLFSLHRSGTTVVEDNKVKSDGFSYEDLEGISLERMQEYVGTIEQDYFKLLDLTLIKMQNPPPPPENVASLSIEEAEQFRNEYNQRQDDKKNAEENKGNEDAKATTPTTENKGATSSRGRPKKGSGKTKIGGEGATTPNAV